jgi:hypothetical protein
LSGRFKYNPTTAQLLDERGLVGHLKLILRRGLIPKSWKQRCTLLLEMLLLADDGLRAPQTSASGRETALVRCANESAELIE